MNHLQVEADGMIRFDSLDDSFEPRSLRVIFVFGFIVPAEMLKLTLSGELDQNRINVCRTMAENPCVVNDPHKSIFAPASAIGWRRVPLLVDLCFCDAIT